MSKHARIKKPRNSLNENSGRRAQLVASCLVMYAGYTNEGVIIHTRIMHTVSTTCLVRVWFRLSAMSSSHYTNKIIQQGTHIICQVCVRTAAMHIRLWAILCPARLGVAQRLYASSLRLNDTTQKSRTKNMPQGLKTSRNTRVWQDKNHSFVSLHMLSKPECNEKGK